MGRAHKERIARIRAGLEEPRSLSEEAKARLKNLKRRSSGGPEGLAAEILLDAELRRKGKIGESVEWVTCNKCKTQMPIYAATDHFRRCQPGGVECTKRKKHFSPEEVADHLRSCYASQPSPEPLLQTEEG